MSSPRARRQQPLSRWTLIPALGALLLGGTATPALADTAPPAPAPVTAPTPPAITSTNAEQTALLQAVSTGKPVTVDSLTTATQLITAQPDGTLTSQLNPLPVRVQQNGVWSALDATLTANSNGTLAPKASASAIKLSGGGGGPLATLTDPAGHSMALTMPFTLPTPTVSGDTAVYQSVLPGVDLSVSVTDQGGFSDVLIIHDATAAANPQLKQLTLAASTSGLTLAATASGGMAATRADGTLAYTSPTPVMWDSSSTATSSPAPSPSASTSASASVSAGASASPSAQSAQMRAAALATASATPSASSTPDAGTGATASSPDGPGTGAQVDPIAMTTTASGITLTPDAAVLTSPSTTYPLYLDPYVNPASSPSNAYDEVYSSTYNNCSSSPQYNKPQLHGEGVGYQGNGGACGSGKERSFYALNTSNLNSSMVISKATVTAPATYADSWNCNQNQPITLHTTGSIGPTTDWNNQPGDSAGYAAASTTIPSAANPPNSLCSNHDAVFTVTTQAQKIAAAGIGSWTVGLFGDESNSVNYLRFSSSITLTTYFDIPPSVTYPTVTPGPLATSNGAACNDAASGWLGATSMNGSSSNIKLNTTVSSQVSGTNVTAEFHIWDDMTKDTSGNPATVKWDYANPQASGTPVAEPIGFQIQDGHRYGFSVQGYDGVLYGNSYSNCHFTVDATPPTSPVVTTNPSFPPVGTGVANPIVYAGTGVNTTFSVNATDPLPNNTCTLDPCQASGIDHFRWRLDSPPDANNGTTVAVSTTGTDANGDPTASATLTKVPVTGWGVHTLYVVAVDKAGNASQAPASYTYTAPWNPTTQVTPGDVTGDHIPDLVATTSTGDLTLIPGNTDPAQSTKPLGSYATKDYTGPVLLAAHTDTPAGGTGSWNDYLIAHKGNQFGQQIDDLFALNIKALPHQMYLVKNNLDGTSPGDPSPTGATPGFTTQRNVHVTKPGCLTGAYAPPTARCGTGAGSPNYDSTDWNNVTQIAAPGAVHTPGIADLITVENGQLWLYTGASGGVLSNPVLLGDGDWSPDTLITPGTVSGTPTLWVRDTYGTVYTYPITLDASTQLPTLLHAPTGTNPLTSALSNGSTHLCVDDNLSLTTPGNKVQIHTCNGTNAQNWVLGTDGTVRAMGMCLDAYYAGKANYTPIDLYTCNGGANQQWTPGPNGSLINPVSGRCLDDPASSITNGTQLQLYDCNAGNAQNWNAGNTAPLPAATQTPIAAVPTSAYPSIASPGDINSPSGGPDGIPDLYAVDTHGRLVEYPGGRTAPGSLSLQDPTTLPTHWWALTEGGGAPADSGSLGTSGSDTNQLNLTLSNTAVWGKPDPALAQADTAQASKNTSNNILTFTNTGTDATTTGYAATSGPALDTTKSYTVSAWVNLTTTNGGHDQWAVGQGTNNHQAFQLGYNGSLNAWDFTTTDSDTSSDTSANTIHAPDTNTAALSTWTHLVGVYDAPTGTMTLYVNGRKAGTNNNLTPQYDANHVLNIGAMTALSADGSTTDNPTSGFNGSISDVHVYDSAIGTTPAIGTNPVNLGAISNTATNWWTLTDAAGTTAKDSTGTLPATLTSTGASWSTDATRGTVLNLDGTTGYAATPTPAVTTGSYTVSAWVKLNSGYDTTKYHTALCQRDATSTRCAFYLQYSVALHGWTLVAPSNDAATPTTYYNAGYNVPAPGGTWTHLVATFDATTNTMSLYVNGQLAGTGTDPTPWTATGGPLLIGGTDKDNTTTGDPGSTGQFPGQISDVHIYNTALPLTDAEAAGDTTTINPANFN
ncbi:LamG-like jellyroll fold domain-containing protein [Streptacidiphilus sp. MAP12-16]|uniref:LamG-like jellyroll fold domain-containing protein n=1 Tax=Streptacidiphilus sp. MAP12-16 TaxID=3156300 RepID=UPI0035111C77